MNSPTIAARATAMGMIIGTAAYMARNKRGAARSIAEQMSGHSAWCSTSC